MIAIKPGDDPRPKPVARILGEGTLVTIWEIHGALAKVVELDTLGGGVFKESDRTRTIEKSLLDPMNGEAARFLKAEIAGDWREVTVVSLDGKNRRRVD